MHKFRRDTDHKLRVLHNTRARLVMSARLAGILALVGPISIAGGLPLGLSGILCLRRVDHHEFTKRWLPGQCSMRH